MSAEHVIRDGAFVCTGSISAKCHSYPLCECEQWTRELHGQRYGQVIGFKNGHYMYADETIPPQPGHEDVQQESCWIADWLTATPLDDTYVFENAQAPGTAVFPDGPVEWVWEGDYMTWHYSDATRPLVDEQAAS